MIDFEKGDRIRLVEMGLERDGRPDPDPILPGSTGTVTRVDDLSIGGHTHVGVEWDDGRRLSLVIPPDLAVKL